MTISNTEQICWNVGDVVEGDLDKATALRKLLKSITEPNGKKQTPYNIAVNLHVALCELESIEEQLHE